MKTTTYTPFDVGTRDRIVGLFVIGALLLFLVGFLIPFIQQLNAEEGTPFYTILDQTYGVAPQSTVSLRGVIVGTVADVSITRDGMVRVDIKLSQVYTSFYTNGSFLTVDANIGVNTLLTGSGLILNSANVDNGVMDPGEFLPTETPRGFASILEEIDLLELTDQLTEIVSNVEEITTGINQNQEKVYRSLDNLEAVTASLAEVSRSLPGMIDSVDASLGSLEASLAGVDSLVRNTDKDLQTTLKNTIVLAGQATKTLAEAELLFKEATPVMSQLPTVLVTTDVALQSLTELSDQMGNSWLFGGNSESVSQQRSGPTIHPHDDKLYE
jgi:ABC-type transporter Mla subunit MlaD